MNGLPSLSCGRCGAPKAASGLPCGECGSFEQSISLHLGGVLAVGPGSLGLVAQSGTPADSSYRLQVQTPAGTRSDARLERGMVTVEVQGASDVGRRGEPQALDTLAQVLQNQGFRAKLLGGRDAYGEDAVLSESTQEYTVQVVTIPLASAFWQAAATSSAQTRVSSGSAAEWVREAIVAKMRNTSPAERPSTLLALDARHAGVVGTQEVVAAYLSKYPAPSSEFSVACTWLLGPTPSTSTQVGPSTMTLKAAT